MTEHEDVRLMEEMLREVERVSDQQWESIGRHHTKVETFFSLDVAALGGATAFALFIADKVTGAGLAVLLSLFIGGVLNLGSFVCLLRGYTGFQRPTEAEFVPRPDWIEERVADESWTLFRHYQAQIAGLSRAFRFNEAQHNESLRWRTRGVTLFVAAAAVYGGVAVVFAVLYAIR